MKNFKMIILISVAAITVTSCSTIRYVPNSVNIPLMQDKGDVTGGLALENSASTGGIEANAAVAVSKNIAVMANFISASGDHDDLNLFEAGAGYFKKIEKHGSFESYGGFGGGRIITGNEYSNEKIDKINYNRFFLQSTIGYTNKIVDVAGGFRYGYLFYGDGFNPYEYRSDKNGVHLIEPTVLFRIGYKYVKLCLQYTYTFDISNSDLVNYSDLDNFSLGLHFDFNAAKKNNIPAN